MNRRRNESSYRATNSMDGRFSPNISERTTERIVRYCQRNNLNKTRFVEECVNYRLDELEREMLEELSKEQLIDIIISNRERRL